MGEFILIATLAWFSPMTGKSYQEPLRGSFETYEACYRHLTRQMQAVEVTWNTTPFLHGTQLCVRRADLPPRQQ